MDSIEFREYVTENKFLSFGKRIGTPTVHVRFPITDKNFVKKKLKIYIKKNSILKKNKLTFKLSIEVYKIIFSYIKFFKVFKN